MFSLSLCLILLPSIPYVFPFTVSDTSASHSLCFPFHCVLYFCLPFLMFSLSLCLILLPSIPYVFPFTMSYTSAFHSLCFPFHCVRYFCLPLQSTGIEHIRLSRGYRCSQPAFEKHFEWCLLQYGPQMCVNLLSSKDHEQLLTSSYQDHMKELNEVRFMKSFGCVERTLNPHFKCLKCSMLDHHWYAALHNELCTDILFKP